VLVHDLALIKTLNAGSTGPFKPNDTVTFDITVVNQGDMAASGVEITDYIPAGLTLADTDRNNDGTIGTGLATYDLGAIAIGESLTIPVTYLINGDAIGEIINRAEISDEQAMLYGEIYTGTYANDIDSTPDGIQ